MPTSVFKVLAVSGVIGMASLQAEAATLTFDFSFNNALNGGGVVTGVIEGLSEGTGAATSVRVTSNTLGFGIGEYVGAPSPNTWTVNGGVLTSFNFLSFGGNSSAPAVTDSTLFFDSSLLNGATFRAGLSNDPNGIRVASVAVSTAHIGLTFTLRQPAVIPLPASAWLLLGGLGALAGLGAARRRRAA